MTPFDAGLFADSLARTASPKRRRRQHVIPPIVPQWELDSAITVVLFAGLGGACQGLEEAGCPVHVANNHDAVALAAHAAMHPHTQHVRGDIFDVDPIAATGGRRVKILWASPDCRDHSVAKGGAPRSARVRSLPWQVCRWAGKTAPTIILFENVREIRGWGPLVAKRDKATGRVVKLDGTVAAPGEHVKVREQSLVRDPKHAGRIFKAWVRHLRGMGHAYEDRDLNCADFGVPTARRRLFGVARRDGLPIRWPERTHAPHQVANDLGLQPWVAAAWIIDWSIPMPSIFDRKRPLAEPTMRRIAAGLHRYVLNSPQPFILPITHSGIRRVHPATEPLPTLTTAHRGELAVVAPTLIQAGYGERPGQAPRTLDIEAPIGTMVGASKFALVAAWMVQHNLGMVGHHMAEPVSTLTMRGTQQQLAAGWLTKLRGTCTGQDAAGPVPTISAGGNHVAATAAFLTKYYGTGGQDQPASDPLHTLPSRGRFGVVTVELQGEPYVVADIGMRMLQPHEAAAAHELTLPKLITLDGVTRPLTKTESLRLVGNSVPKRMARLLAEANQVHALYTTPADRLAAD